MSVEGEHAAGARQRSHPTVRQYLLIGLLLTLITVVELAASYSDIGSLLIPILIVLSAVKFAVVVAYFMHLRFEHALLTQLFACGFVLACALLIALIALFWTDSAISNR
jgi:cytochrome c oxidase subunit 4